MPKIHDNFELALEKLTEFMARYDGSEVQRAGIIQAFEFTYEQCWHTLKKLAQQNGVSASSPKSAFSFAFKMSFFAASEEPLCLKMIEDRNKANHTYRDVVAQEVFDRIQKDYLKAFQGILTHVKNSG